MISLPRRMTLWAGLINKYCMFNDFFWMKFLILAFIAFPLLTNSKWFLCALLVLFVVVCRWRAFAPDIWSGRWKSEWDVNVKESIWWASISDCNVRVWLAERVVLDVSVSHRTVTAIKIIGIRYLSRWYFTIINYNTIPNAKVIFFLKCVVFTDKYLVKNRVYLIR